MKWERLSIMVRIGLGFFAKGTAMTNEKKTSVAARSALIAIGVSLGVLIGQFARECITGHGVCSFNSPTLWLIWAAAFLGAWGAIAVAMWGLERHRRNHAGNESR